MSRKLEKMTRIEYIAEALCTLATALLCYFYLPDQMKFIGVTKSKWFLVLLAASPALFTFALSQAEKKSLFSSIYLWVAEIAVIMIILYNKGIFTPKFEVIGLFALSILFIWEGLHLRGDHPMGSSMCLNFKWVTDPEAWKELQKKGSLLVLSEGILIAVGALLHALGVLGLGVIIPVIVVTFYIITFYLMKTSK